MSMDDGAPLDYMLDQPNAPMAGRDELHAIVARSSRRRTRITAAGMAATLAVGGAVGWAVAGGSSGGGTNVAVAHAGGSTTVAPPYASAALGNSSVSATLGAPFAQSMTKQFVRTTSDGVTIRGYELQVPKNLPEPLVNCGLVFSGFQAEISTAEIAGQAGGGFQTQSPKAPFDSVQPMTLGVAEGAPVWVVTTKTTAAAVKVRVTFADGKTDQMAPVAGWAALAHVAPAEKAPAAAPPALPTGTVDALDAAGKVVGSVSLLEAVNVPKPLPSPPQTVTGSSSSAGGAPAVAGTTIPASQTARPLPVPTIPPAVIAEAAGSTGAPAVTGGTAGTGVAGPVPAGKPGVACPVPAPLLPTDTGGPTGAILTPGSAAVTTTIQAATAGK